ncbi:MAG: 28S ribosomal protein S2, mitochondrial, partial [Paramarteilia canceri]
ELLLKNSIISAVSANLPSIEELFNARVHFGHKSGLRHPDATNFLFGTRPIDGQKDIGRNFDIIDLDITRKYLRRALEFVSYIIAKQGSALFITLDRQTCNIVEKAAKECSEFAHCRHFLSGTFTNRHKFFNEFSKMPDVCIFFNTRGNRLFPHPAIAESSKLLIPSIAILDSDCKMKHITYGIPGNDDSPSSVKLFADTFKNVILQTKEVIVKMPEAKNENQ